MLISIFEELSSSSIAAVTCFIGMHFGHILVHFKDHKQRLLLWSLSSFLLLISGYILDLLGIPLSKPLYPLSYMCITAGASGLLLTVIFYLVDVKKFGNATLLLKWMGVNALIVYALAACEIFPAVVQGFYWRSPKNNMVDLTESFLQAALNSRKWGTLAFVLLEILFWCMVAGFLHMKGIYMKL
ncbi:uncharacterized protein LOC110808136 [Carica papaya]|uniref:uncharacterized protein LOC110808136 n=1 Tax=Carica papaya TaxID=3649 RepID=UPI000B8C9C9D|nr:uncharacterized protein LOC110808136 [Carica papaya]